VQHRSYHGAEHADDDGRHRELLPRPPPVGRQAQQDAEGSPDQRRGEEGHDAEDDAQDAALVSVRRRRHPHHAMPTRQQPLGGDWQQPRDHTGAT
jgi:hypothetical protein